MYLFTTKTLNSCLTNTIHAHTVTHYLRSLTLTFTLKESHLYPLHRLVAALLTYTFNISVLYAKLPTLSSHVVNYYEEIRNCLPNFDPDSLPYISHRVLSHVTGDLIYDPHLPGSFVSVGHILSAPVRPLPTITCNVCMDR